MSGHDDPQVRLASSLALADTFNESAKESEVHVFGRAGHNPFQEYPDAFNRVVSDFCSR